ncbi:BMP family ABC transporter substrate-binding protein [Agrobacterium vitis]|uniref:BMP family lipoprotein n=1 Tax=Agrobacterium vitis TaxID=373 RepID=UPI001F457389|nr:BMP family ABC transporter substrate-binding protein [Agrobacterium vitis]MCF1470041.1 BMP family ABC transporter substrate-binding protein [Agrobacterium vitis]
MNFKSTMLIATTALASVLGILPANAAEKPAALIIAQGGLGDQSFNDLAYTGFQRALKETGLKGKPVESKEVVAQAADILRRASDADFGLIVDLEYSHGEPMLDVAKDYPDTTFAILNQVQKGDNIVSVLFQEQEGSYLAGVLAAQVTTDTSIKGINAEPIIGVIGGTKSAGIDKFIAGYIEGAKSVNPKIVVKVAYSNNFADPALGQQMAKAMFEEGADIIYQVAGGTGAGVIQAAKETGHFAIGVDGDQDGVAPGNVLTSMIKKTDVAVEGVVKDYAKDVKLGGATVTYGLKEGGVGLSDMKFTRNIIPAAYLEKVEAAKADIISGKIKVWNVVEQGYPAYLK